MTPDDIEILRRVIGQELDTKLATALQPIRTRLAKLEETDRKHSTQIRATDEHVERSNHEIREATNESLLAASRHMASSIGELRLEFGDLRNEVREIKRTTTSIAPAAEGAERAAHRAEGKTDALAVDLSSVEQRSRKALAWHRSPMFQSIVTVFVGAILSWFAQHFHLMSP